jgi:hypothetical protein
MKTEDNLTPPSSEKARCPTCRSDDPEKYGWPRHESENQPCSDPFHTPLAEDEPTRCPTCGSDDPDFDVATSGTRHLRHEQPPEFRCPDPFHGPERDVSMVLPSREHPVKPIRHTPEQEERVDAYVEEQLRPTQDEVAELRAALETNHRSARPSACYGKLRPTAPTRRAS